MRYLVAYLLFRAQFVPIPGSQFARGICQICFIRNIVAVENRVCCVARYPLRHVLANPSLHHISHGSSPQCRVGKGRAFPAFLANVRHGASEIRNWLPVRPRENGVARLLIFDTFRNQLEHFVGHYNSTALVVLCGARQKVNRAGFQINLRNAQAQQLGLPEAKIISYSQQSAQPTIFAFRLKCRILLIRYKARTRIWLSKFFGESRHTKNLWRVRFRAVIEHGLENRWLVIDG
jgi:hypothetical protein